ncbi:MAG: helix-turn-helix domain-containing protein [Steroidobacteraceae bacterium]|jgi:DNA-binding transcriptional ArsR family regulator
MKDGPHIARVAALLGDPARSDALTALMSDRALTASELASIAGVTKQTMSAHLAKLLDAALVAVEQQGRHRYFRLADEDVARLLESLMGVAFRTGAVRLIASPREPALRHARICYDHLAGALGVWAFEELTRHGVLKAGAQTLQLGARGATWFKRAGIEALEVDTGRRLLCRACLDWSERRHHLAGALGAALLRRVDELGWAKRERRSRIVRFSPRGERAFRQLVQSAAH